MDYQINSFVIDVPDVDDKTSADQLDMDFFLQQDFRKVILGTVRFSDGKPAPCSVVKVFRPKDHVHGAESTSDLEPVGHAITDDNGQFILGPVYPGETIVLKIMHLNGSIAQPGEEPVRGTFEPEGCIEDPELEE